MDKLLLTVEQAAKKLSISRAKAYSMVAAGELPFVRIGRGVRIPYEGLLEWVRTRVNGPTPNDTETGGDCGETRLGGHQRRA